MGTVITNNTNDVKFVFGSGKEESLLKSHAVSITLREDLKGAEILSIGTGRHDGIHKISDIVIYHDLVTSPVTADGETLRNLLLSYFATAYTQSASDTFVNGDLAAGILPIAHNLGSTNILVAVKDNNDIVTPYTATVVDANNCTIDLSAVAPITGTWTWMVFKV